ncbi:MAG: MFS transporter [Thermoguttaceae bacterium]
MTPVAAPTLHPPRPHRRTQSDVPPQLRPARQPRPSEQAAGYDRPFWLAYAANLLLASAASLLFRYADFVTLLGGTEFHLGWIVGVGMVGSLAMRLFLGSWIDRYGARLLWLGSLLLFVATCFAHLAVASHTGAAIYLLRIGYCCAVAGVGGSSMTFVSMRTCNDRLAEMVGMLGTGGFVGIVVGTELGDLLFGSVGIVPAQVAQMFIVAALLGLLAVPFAWAAARGQGPGVRGQGSGIRGQGAGVRDQGTGIREQGLEIRNSKSANLQICKSSNLQISKSLNPSVPREPSLLSLVRRYSPGDILIIGVTMGMALGLPGTFLRTFAAERGIPRIGLFFLVYCIAAVAIRVPTRRWAERFGPRRIILLGMAGMTASVAIFPLVRTEWHLAFPAIGFGCSHAILWPAVVAAGSVAFPPKNRGLATVLLLAAWDLGLVVASPAVGIILSHSASLGLPPYPTMFLSMAALLTLVTLWYAAHRPAPAPAAATQPKSEQKAA